MAAPCLIVGLGHRKRVGKDTFAGMLEYRLERWGYEVYKCSFAYDMKELATNVFEMYGLRGAHHYEVNPNHRVYPLEGIDKTPRQIWIEFGNAMRSIHPGIWVERLRDQIDSTVRHKMLYPGKPLAFIISDVRFPNEAEAVRAWGGTLAKVVRPSVPCSDDAADSALEHYGGWEWLIRNDSGLNWLEAQAAAFANYVHGKQNKQPWRLS